MKAADAAADVVEAGILYSPPLKYTVLSRTGLKLRVGIDLGSAGAGRVDAGAPHRGLARGSDQRPADTYCLAAGVGAVHGRSAPGRAGATLRVVERRALPPLEAGAAGVVRLRVAGAAAGWLSELPTFVALGSAQAVPFRCGAALPAEVARRATAARNARGQVGSSAPPCSLRTKSLHSCHLHGFGLGDRAVLTVRPRRTCG